MNASFSIDVLTLFPQYFSPVKLSLLGRAIENGIIGFQAHDLRDYSLDARKTVDKPPISGGAGQVLLPEVITRGIETIVNNRKNTLIAFPSPTGHRLSQKWIKEITVYEQIVIPCGRYEGIDARVVRYLEDNDYQVIEYSLGDFVLFGGEVAALALIEATVRLQKSVLGNPSSLLEESFSDGLLEAPMYTKPNLWRGYLVPPVLLSGNHEAIRKYRRKESLRLTVERRPDLLENLQPDKLEIEEKRFLIEQGYLISEQLARIKYYSISNSKETSPSFLQKLASFAASTFPLASPDSIPESDIADFIEANLSTAAFRVLLDNPQVLLTVAIVYGGFSPPRLEEVESYEIAAYSLVLPTNEEISLAVGTDVLYLSKFYVAKTHHSTGVASVLLDKTITEAKVKYSKTGIGLGTNVENYRAIRFYRKHGFRIVAKRDFLIGSHIGHDNIMYRDL